MNKELTQTVNELTRNEFINEVIAQLKVKGIEYGAFYKTEELRQLAGPFGKDETMFSFFKLELRKRFADLRLLLTEKGLSGAGMRIAQPVEIYHFAKSWIDQADNAHDRAEFFLAGNDQSRLTEAEKLRDTNLLRQIAHRRMLLRRAEDVVKVLERRAPAILKADIETPVEVID
jgi:hypothetical protein